MFLFVCFEGCTNPTKIVEPHVREFKDTYPNQITSVYSGGRRVQLAWSGDPRLRPLIFVHGSPGSWEGWAWFLVNRKLQSHYQLIAVDRLGYGGSEPGKTARALKDQLLPIAAALQLNTSGLAPILVGHSYGGPVVAKWAVTYPQQTAGVVFVASSVSPALEETKWIQIPATWWPFRSLIPTSLRVCNEEILALKPELELMLPEWQKFIAKVAIIHGGQDDLVAPANADFIVNQLPHREQSLVSDQRVAELNHFVPWKTPELIVTAIERIETAQH